MGKKKNTTAPAPPPVDWEEVYFACKRKFQNKERATDKRLCDAAWKENATKFGIVQLRAKDDA